MVLAYTTLAGRREWILPGRLPNRRRAIGLRSASDGYASTRHPDIGPWRRAMPFRKPYWPHWPTRRWRVFSRPGGGEIKRSPTRTGKTQRRGGAVAKRWRCGVMAAATQMWAPLRVCRRREMRSKGLNFICAHLENGCSARNALAYTV